MSDKLVSTCARCSHPRPKDRMVIDPQQPPPRAENVRRISPTDARAGPPFDEGMVRIHGAQRLPDDILANIADQMPLSEPQCLFALARLSSKLYRLIRPRLYHTIDFDPSDPASVPLGLLEHDRHVGMFRFRSTRHVRIRSHHIWYCWWSRGGAFVALSDTSPHLKVDVVRLDFDGSCEHGHAYSATTPQWEVIFPCCPILEHFDARTLVLFGLYHRSPLPLEQTAPESCETIISVLAGEGMCNGSMRRTKLSVRPSTKLRSCVFVFWTEKASTPWRPATSSTRRPSRMWLHEFFEMVIRWAAEHPQSLTITFVGLERTYATNNVEDHLSSACMTVRQDWAAVYELDEWDNTAMPVILQAHSQDGDGPYFNSDHLRLVKLSDFLDDRQAWQGALTEEEVHYHLSN